MKHLFAKLQNAPRKQKDRWIIALTIVVMIIVLVVWLKYFNTLLRVDTTEQESSRRSFTDTLKNGMVVVWSAITDWFGSLGGPKEIRIAP